MAKAKYCDAKKMKPVSELDAPHSGSYLFKTYSKQNLIDMLLDAEKAYVELKNKGKIKEELEEEKNKLLEQIETLEQKLNAANSELNISKENAMQFEKELEDTKQKLDNILLDNEKKKQENEDALAKIKELENTILEMQNKANQAIDFALAMSQIAQLQLTIDTLSNAVTNIKRNIVISQSEQGKTSDGKRGPKPISDDVKAERTAKIKELRESGASIRQIAAALKLSNTTILEALHN